MDMNTEIFYTIGGAKFGPISQNDLSSLFCRGIIKPDTKLWWKGMSTWVEYRLLFHAVDDNPPPLAGKDVNNTIVWIIAFAPLLTSIIAYCITGVLEGLFDTIFNDTLPTIIMMALNIFLCWTDEKNLKKAGYDVDAMKGWIWLIPVYLFKRAKLLAQSNAYAIVWCVMLLVSSILGL